MHYVLLFVVVVLIDLIPVFGPPAWMAAVFLRLKYHLAFVSVVLITALATVIGRTLLAIITRKAKRYIPAKYVQNLDYSKRLLSKNRQGTRLAVGLFLFSPLPSAQLFEAAGLLDVRLGPLAAAFFMGRLVTVSLYVGFAHLTVTGFRSLLERGLTSAWAVGFELLCILVIAVLLNIHLVVQGPHKPKGNKKRR